MDALHSTHPSRESLQAYSLGRLDDTPAEAVSRHLERCPECQRRVAEMTPDTFLDKLRGVQSGPEMSDSDASIQAEAQTDQGRCGVAEEATREPVAPSAQELTTGTSPSHPVTQPEPMVKDDPTLDHGALRTSPVVSDSGQTGTGDNSVSDGIQSRTRIRYFGDYEQLKVLGEGGMGIVYEARQLSLNRLVALKMIKAARFVSDDKRRRFHNEAEAVAQLDHANIVPIYEVGQYEDQHYFSMKLISGESLDKRLKDYAADFKGAARVVATVASAAHHAHQRGILHRDLKPANILLDTDGQPHVTDFGLAKRAEADSELTRSGAILGTPAYMAPEQASGHRGTVTTLTDVYGVGAILYTALTGSAPFNGTTVLDTLEQVRERAPDLPRKLNPRIPRAVEVICLKCLEKDPRRRYASADAICEDLNRWLAGEPIAARATGQIERVLLWVRRRPTAAALATTTLVATIAIITAGFFVTYNNELKRAHRSIEEAHVKLEITYASEARARRQAEAAEKDASDQRKIAENALREARNALDLANSVLGATQVVLKYSPQLELPLTFPVADSPEFQQAMSRNQAIAERLAYGVDEVRTPLIHRAAIRARETLPQLHGYYDLVLGRLLAMKVRCYEYNWACARMKKDPPKLTDPRSNAWKLVPDSTVKYSASAAATVREAETLLRRVIDKYPGTDWALQAQRELDTPCGFKWVATYVQPIQSEARAAANPR